MRLGLGRFGLLLVMISFRQPLAPGRTLQQLG